MSHKQVLEMFAKSIIYVGLSESDGIRISMLEAMAMGATPVQTSTACCDEWFGDSGVAVRYIIVPATKAAIRQGLKLAEDPRHPQKNLQMIKDKDGAKMVRDMSKHLYLQSQHACNHMRPSGKDLLVRLDLYPSLV